MGPEDFRRGISQFLTKFKYANAVTQDLWDVLEEVSSENLKITSIMDTWTRQMGYPVINVKKPTEENYIGWKLTLFTVGCESVARALSSEAGALPYQPQCQGRG